MMEGCLMLNKMTRFDRDVVSDHVLCYTCFLFMYFEFRTIFDRLFYCYDIFVLMLQGLTLGTQEFGS